LTAGGYRSAIRGRFTETEVPQLSLHSPFGDISVSEQDGAIVAVDWGWGRDQQETRLLARTRDQLFAYFDRELIAFDLPLAPAGTEFQRRVWAALQRIPYGQTRSYGALAVELGSAARAVGQANAANPIPIVIPCHRVVASSGIGGYSGGDGLATKRALLALETGAAALL
jgi:methylated-DNA-[protein]-cysteine S-methyltransferase